LKSVVPDGTVIISQLQLTRSPLVTRDDMPIRLSYEV
jgi:hypothetical protein